MRFKPRHYLLIVLILALGAFNFYRARRAHQPAVVQSPVRSTDTTPAVVAAWAAYDHAAGLRDGKTEDFRPALVTLDSTTANLQPFPLAASDLEACRIWLLSYRDGTMSGPGGRNKSSQHIDRCVQLHRDAAQ